MDKADIKEKIGRTYFKQDYDSKYIMDFTDPKYDKVDVYMTAVTDPSRIYVVEIKCYCDKDHIRYSDKFPNYMLDFNKVFEVWDIAREEGRIPLIIVYFTDNVVIWDLNKIGIKTLQQRVDYRPTNTTGVDYGKGKSFSHETYLYLNESVIITPNTHVL